MGMAVSQGGSTKSDINITPLVDILLVLLVIFMVMTPLMVTGLKITIPSAASTAQAEAIIEKEEKPVILTVKKDGKIFWNQDLVDGGIMALPQKVATAYQTRIDKSIFFQADAKTRYEDVVQVVDICNRYGVETLGMMIANVEKKY